jgi:hypothetical protein
MDPIALSIEELPQAILPTSQNEEKLTELNNFIKNAINVHGNKYDYSLVKYKNKNTKVDILCKTHGVFKQIPYNHINKQCGCIKCKQEKKSQSTLENRKIEFIEKAIAIHGDKYDYSKVVYIDSKTPVIIICNVCGDEFPQIRNTHLTGDGGCKNCIKIRLKKTMTFTTDEFIKRAISKHGNKYDYSQVMYIDSQTHVNISCLTCNYNFPITPNNHIRGRGCKKCSNELKSLNKRKPQEQFINEAKIIHVDENDEPIYDYSKVIYKNCHKNIIIICKIHGKFEQCPSQHLSGRGCKCCGIIKSAKSQTFTQDEFIERAIAKHGDKYDYSLVKYVSSQTKILIICNFCGDLFEQIPNSHLQGCGCDNCAHRINHENQKLDEIEVVRRCKEKHGDKYGYSNINYKNSSTPIDILCKTCGNPFSQLYGNHINQNQGCPKCIERGCSRKQTECLKVLSIVFNVNIKHGKGKEYKLNIKGKRPVDGFIEKQDNPPFLHLDDSKDTILQFHGSYWHGCPKWSNKTNVYYNDVSKKPMSQLYDKTLEKDNEIISLGYNLIVIWEFDYEVRKQLLKQIKTLRKNYL